MPPLRPDEAVRAWTHAWEERKVITHETKVFSHLNLDLCSIHKSTSGTLSARNKSAVGEVRQAAPARSCRRIAVCEVRVP